MLKVAGNIVTSIEVYNEEDYENIKSFKDMTANKFLVKDKWYNDNLLRDFQKRS